MTWSLSEQIRSASPNDPSCDYCLWPYQRPCEPSPESWQSSALLYHSFAVAGVSEKMVRFCKALQATVGPFKTVWGVKHANGQMSWEFYFYDYTRMERRFSTADFCDLAKNHVTLDVPVNDSQPYFMFSVEVGAAEIDQGVPITQLDLYLGNPGSEVSSGICYGLTKTGMELRNFYFFFDALKHAHDIREKIVSNAHVPLNRLNLSDIIWPNMTKAQTIVVANKRMNDGLYFSRIPVDDLLSFMKRLDFPSELQMFAAANAHRFQHVLFDVGYDYDFHPDDGVRYLKGSYYGLL
nr:hypothetical protein [uncultured Shimia sp.]